MNAYYRADRPHCKTLYVRFEHKGKAVLKKTPYTNKEQALSWARAYRASLDKADHEEIKTALDRARYRKPAADVTIAQITAAYQQHAPTREIRAGTITLNINALHNILRTAGVAAPGSEPAALITTLNADLVDDYKTAILKRATMAPDTAAADSMYRSANSLLRQARSIFTADLLDHYRRKQKLTIPDLAPFLQRTAFAKASKSEYNPPAQPTINKTFQALETLHHTDLNAYLAIWLAIGFGLRKSEAAHITPASFLTIENRPAIRITEKTKNGETNVTILCQLDAWQRLAPHIAAAMAANQPYLLTGTHTERTEDTFRRISDWMRTLGWQTQKTIHEFRAWAGCQIATKDPRGLLAARDFLRHGQFNTTERYYGRYIDKLRIAHIPLQLPLLSTPTLLQANA